MAIEVEPTVQEEITRRPADIVKVLVEKVTGHVKWFSTVRQYGFINRLDNNEDVFVHRSAIAMCKRRFPSLRNGEEVEFSVMETTSGIEAGSVTGPGGAPVKGAVRPWRRQADSIRRPPVNGKLGGASEEEEKQVSTEPLPAGENGNDMPRQVNFRGGRRRGAGRRGGRRGGGSANDSRVFESAGEYGDHVPTNGEDAEGASSPTVGQPRQRRRSNRRGRGRGAGPIRPHPPAEGQEEGDLAEAGDAVNNRPRRINRRPRRMPRREQRTSESAPDEGEECNGDQSDQQRFQPAGGRRRPPRAHPRPIKVEDEKQSCPLAEPCLPAKEPENAAPPEPVPATE